MGNVPSEANMGNRLRCCKCNKVLPPCTSFENIYKSTVHGRYVHVFNGGRYYRPVGHNDYYECEYCFNKPKDRRREEERLREEARKREEERLREEARKREEEQRRAEERERQERERREEERMQRELDQKLEESFQKAQDHLEQELINDITKEHEMKQNALISHLNEYENQDPGDKLLEILSSKFRMPIAYLSISQLTAEQLRNVLSTLDELLFDEWIQACPSLETLQHAQVFLTDLCVLAMEQSEIHSLRYIANQTQTLVESISHSTVNATENFLLTQALYLNLMHFYIHPNSSGVDAAIIAQCWAKDQLTPENLFLIEFLGTLIISLQEAQDKASWKDSPKISLQSLRLLMDILGGLNGHAKSPQSLLKLVQRSQWTPAKGMVLLKELSNRYEEDASISHVLELVEVYKVTPQWRDDSGKTLIEALDSVGPGGFLEILRMQDNQTLKSVVAEQKNIRNLDDDISKEIEKITHEIVTGSVVQSSFAKDSFKSKGLDVALYQLCEAVFETKGWWPNVQQMVSWCALVLTEKFKLPQLVAMEENPCVIAMFAAAQVCHGHKVDLVLSSDIDSYMQTKEWSDFYEHLNISFATNMNKVGREQREAYEAEIVYGTIDDFVSDYFAYGYEAMKSKNPYFNRGFIIAEQCFNKLHDLELLRLKENNMLELGAKTLQNLMSSFHSVDIKDRHMCGKALFQLLHSTVSEFADADSKIANISQKTARRTLSFHEVYTLNFFESLLKSLGHRLCLESLFTCATQLQVSCGQTYEQFEMVSNLVAQQLWSPGEAVKLLGALSDHHHDEGCISVKKILHQMQTYQVSSEWRDEKGQSILELLKSPDTQNIIKHLETSLSDEKIKTTDTIFDEIRQMKNIDEQTLKKAYSIVTTVLELIKSGEMENHKDVQRAKTLCHSTKTEDLQEVLAVLCNAVHLNVAKGIWWPRTTQMISWCLLALSDNGKLLEMPTGEGKSCVIAMFAALRGLRSEKVDVVSSSSVLCQRDAEEWVDFYAYLGLTVDTNTNKKTDKERKKCYQKDVIYGTIEIFAADYLRQIFEMKDVRPDRGFQCIIIDEVDSLLLDQGVQLTYLSSPMVSMQHLNIIMTMIWGHVCQYSLLFTGYQTFVQGPPASFFKAIFDSINTDETEINDPIDVLRIAEESNVVPQGFAEDIYKCEKDDLLMKLKTVSQDAVVEFFHDLENYVPYDFTIYTLGDNGLLSLKKPSTYNNPEIPDLAFLVLDDGLCCPLYASEDTITAPIAELISEKIQYTPCTNDKNKVSVPGFLRGLVEKKILVWVQNAFLALRLREGKEYVVENDAVCPVDFKSTGIVELSKKWGDGLQQFVEIKHQVKMSAISAVTNYVSNVAFFEKYNGKIYGTSGTLGNDIDMHFLKQLYPNLSACKIPTFNQKKLFEVKGILTNSEKEWKSALKQVVMDQISSKPYRKGRAALVICETINKAKEIHQELKGIIPGEIILYCRSDKDSLSRIDKELLPGDVIVATNLAGRGTDIKVSKVVNNNGGLFVALSFLSENTRVELQAFGRTSRKGKPGSAQIIMNTEHLSESFSTVSSLEEAKETRQQLSTEKIKEMMYDVNEMKLREELFAQYCKTLEDIYEKTDGDEERAIVAIMNEFWGIWLQAKSEEIDQLKRDELLKSLKTDLTQARIQTESQSSPCSSTYHYIKFGNIFMGEEKWDASIKLFEKAMTQDENWAAVAFYSHAYCTIKKQNDGYIDKAINDLNKALESLKYLSEECLVSLQFVKVSSVVTRNDEPTSLEKQFTTKCSMFSLFDKNITEGIKKLKEIKEKKRDALAKKTPMFSLVSDADEELQQEAYDLYNRGLKYVFTVEEAPRFPWEALLVFCFGVLQIVGGALLTAFTFGTAAQAGMGLISEGISDVITGIESMIKAEFSWQTWAIEKAISIATSLLSFGVGKLISKGFKAISKISSTMMKQVGKQMKAMPKLMAHQTKQSFSVVTKTNLKNAVKLATKTMVEQMASYGLEKAEEKILDEIIDAVKTEVKKGISDNVKFHMDKEPLIDIVILSHLEPNQKYTDLFQNEDRKQKLLKVFKHLNTTALQPFYDDLSWQNTLNSKLATVIESAKSEASGKLKAILTAIQVIHVSALAADAISTVLKLSDKFFFNLNEGLRNFKSLPVRAEQKKRSADEPEMLNKFKRELVDSTSAQLSDALVEVFQQKFSSHIIKHVQGNVNKAIVSKVSSLKSKETDKKLQSAQERRSNALDTYMKSRESAAKGSGNNSHALAEKIRRSQTKGTTMDAKVLAESTGTNIVILKKDTTGKLQKAEELKPSTKATEKTVTLVEHKPGQYSAVIKKAAGTAAKEVIDSLFSALAEGLKPSASKEELKKEEELLRSSESEILLKHPGRWGRVIQRNGWAEEIRGGDWYMDEETTKQDIIAKSKMMIRVDLGRVTYHTECILNTPWSHSRVVRSLS